MSNRYFARSASDRTDDWPFWFIADRQKGGLNITGEEIARRFGNPRGAVFLPRETAQEWAGEMNGAT